MVRASLSAQHPWPFLEVDVLNPTSAVERHQMSAHFGEDLELGRHQNQKRPRGSDALNAPGTGLRSWQSWGTADLEPAREREGLT